MSHREAREEQPEEHCGPRLFFAVFATFVAMGWAPGALALFGAVDFAGAIWTWSALRAAPQGQR